MVMGGRTKIRGCGVLWGYRDTDMGLRNGYELTRVQDCGLMGLWAYRDVAIWGIMGTLNLYVVTVGMLWALCRSLRVSMRNL